MNGAGFTLNSFLHDKFSTELGEDIEFYPGTFTPNAGIHKFVVYTVKPGKSHKPYINVDVLRLKLHHTNFSMLIQLASLVLSELSTESMYENAGLMAALLSDGYKPHDVIVSVTDTDQNLFIDNTTYFKASIDIIIEYVEV